MRTRFSVFRFSLITLFFLSSFTQLPVAASARSTTMLKGPQNQEVKIKLYRKLGVETRDQYQKELIQVLGELVAIPTVKKEDQPQHENPAIHQLGKAIEKIASGFNLDYRNVDDRIFEVTLKGTSEETIGVVTHGDIVPFNPAKWVLTDGRRLDPLKLTIIGDKMYGRGARYDKASIVAALFAMGAIKREGLALKRTIRLMIETTEKPAVRRPSTIKNIISSRLITWCLMAAIRSVSRRKASESCGRNSRCAPVRARVRKLSRQQAGVCSIKCRRKRVLKLLRQIHIG